MPTLGTNLPYKKDAFVAEMIKFYRACDVAEDAIDFIMRESDPYIGKYLMATPELIARKMYQEVMERPL